MAAMHPLIVRYLRLCCKVRRRTLPPPRRCRPPPPTSLASLPLLSLSSPPSMPSSMGSASPPSPPASVTTALIPLSSPPLDPAMPSGSATLNRLPLCSHLRHLCRYLPCPSQPPPPLPRRLNHPLCPRGLLPESSPFAEAVPVFAVEHHTRVLRCCHAHLCSPLLLQCHRRPLHRRCLPRLMPRPSPKETKGWEKKQATLGIPFSPSLPSPIPCTVAASLPDERPEKKKRATLIGRPSSMFDRGPPATVDLAVHKPAHRPCGL